MNDVIKSQLPYIILGIIAAYFLILTAISNWVSKGASDNETFFIANRKAPWYLVTIGLIGASISGVTFVSVPGKVGTDGFAYFQLVLGYVLGYAVIALVLMPIYYRMNLVSIYGYLEERFGIRSYKIGAAFFLISRLLGSAARMYLMVMILQTFALSPLGVPVWITAFVCVGLVWLYTYKGGTKTILYTDVLLTGCFIIALIFTMFSLSSSLDKNIFEMMGLVWNNQKLSQIFYFSDVFDSKNFFKQFITGALITITMTGLDQDLMQKNLACKNIKDAQKNMFTFSAIIVVVNLLFLFLGGFLYEYAFRNGLTPPGKTDLMYPEVAFKSLGIWSVTFFIIGIVASTFSSSDSALTALTTAFCIDFLNFNKKTENIDPSKYEYNNEKIAIAQDEIRQNLTKTRLLVHTGMAITLFIIMMIFAFLNKQAVIDAIFKIAGYTYGPLLGLYAFGLFVPNRIINDKLSPVVCIVGPIIGYLIDFPATWGGNPDTWLMGFKLGHLIILINGLLVFAGLWLISKENDDVPENAL